MYGLVIESLVEYIRQVYGEEEWDTVRRIANIDQLAFSTNQKYSESVIPQIITAASKHFRVTESALMESVGVFFVTFVGRYGYDRVMSVLGRHVRDFLNGLDNLHEYMRFSYPRMRPPSFFCEEEDKNGLKLHYRTRRQGFVYYTMGQIKAVGEQYYNTPIDIEIVMQERLMKTIHVVFQLRFDNTGYDEDNIVVFREGQFLPVTAEHFFDIFPFSIFFNKTLTIGVLGSSLQTIMAKAVGCQLVDVFSLVRPIIDFSWESILTRLNNVFELVALETTNKSNGENDDVIPFNSDDYQEEMKAESKYLKLKGQMLFMEEWDGIIYLGAPVMPDLEAMLNTGLYINDLSMHDFSRDLVLAGTQQSVELKLALDQEQQKSKRLEESMRKLDEEMKRTDELLYQMIPKQVADRLREGDAAVDTCEVFDSVTILFSDVVTFTEMCSRITPMEVVSLLNAMYSLFDRLTEIHGVYKVETIGDAYMVVGGAPTRSKAHAQDVANMSLDMLQVITGLKDPSTNESIRIRVGIHSGTVVAGVVGIKMPRYCLFGDAVNTASRMESTSEPMKIQITEEARALLPDIYYFSDRGTVPVKGKGRVQTYWLTGRKDYIAPTVWDEAPAESPHYSPVMVADKILKRDSLAYSTLSPLSTPYPSRPTTSETTGKLSAPSAPPISVRLQQPTSQPTKEPKQTNPTLGSKSPRPSPYRPVPLQRSKPNSAMEKTPEMQPQPPPLPPPPEKTRPPTATVTRTTVAPRMATTTTVTTMAPTKVTGGTEQGTTTNITTTAITSTVASAMTSTMVPVMTSSVVPGVTTAAMTVTNAVYPFPANDLVANKQEVASANPQPQTLTIPQQKIDNSATTTPSDGRQRVQQVVPHMHCSVQCQSTSCRLQ